MKQAYKPATGLLCIFLSVLLLLPALLSCGETKQETQTPPPGTGSDTTGETEEARVPPLAYLGQRNFEGRVFNVLVSGMDNSEWRQNNIDADAENPEIINSARFNRNIELEDTLNIKLTSSEHFGGNGPNELKTAYKAGDEIYNCAQLMMTDAAKLTEDGYFIDMTTLPDLHLEDRWWDQRSVEDMTINGKLYHAVNASCIASYNATFAVLFNKDLDEKYHVTENQKIGSPYEAVIDGKWTYDLFSAMVRSVSHDLNGDGKMGPQDLFGLCLWVDSITGAINSGLEYCCQVNEDGQFELTLDTERVQDIVDKFVTFAADANVTADYINKGYSSYDLFAGDHALFYMQEINRITAFRDMESDFGILPMPKFDEAQQVYRSCVAENDGVLLGVPALISDEEFTGCVLDGLARLSEEYVMPAYYDITLQRKAARDEESGRMLDIIFTTRAYDLGWIYQVGALKNNMKSIVQGGESNISRIVAKRRSMVSRMLKDINEAFEKVG